MARRDQMGNNRRERNAALSAWLSSGGDLRKVRMSAEDLRLPDFPVTERCGSGCNPRGSAESAGSPAFHVRIERCTGAEALSVRNQGTLETRSGLNGTCGECWEAGMGLRHAVAFRTRCAAELGRIGLYRPRFGVILESRKLQRLESVRAPSSVSVP